MRKKSIMSPEIKSKKCPGCGKQLGISRTLCYIIFIGDEKYNPNCSNCSTIASSKHSVIL